MRRFDFVRGFTGEAVREYLEAASSQFTVGEYWDSLNYNGGVPDHNQVHRDLPLPPVVCSSWQPVMGLGFKLTVQEQDQSSVCFHNLTVAILLLPASCVRSTHYVAATLDASSWFCTGRTQAADGELDQGGGRPGDGLRRDHEGHPPCCVRGSAPLFSICFLAAQPAVYTWHCKLR